MMHSAVVPCWCTAVARPAQKEAACPLGGLPANPQRRTRCSRPVLCWCPAVARPAQTEARQRIHRGNSTDQNHEFVALNALAGGFRLNTISVQVALTMRSQKPCHNHLPHANLWHVGFNKNQHLVPLHSNCRPPAAPHLPQGAITRHVALLLTCHCHLRNSRCLRPTALGERGALGRTVDPWSIPAAPHNRIFTCATDRPTTQPITTR